MDLSIINQQAVLVVIYLTLALQQQEMTRLGKLLLAFTSKPNKRTISILVVPEQKSGKIMTSTKKIQKAKSSSVSMLQITIALPKIATEIRKRIPMTTPFTTTMLTELMTR